jgi:hypothetical protein
MYHYFFTPVIKSIGIGIASTIITLCGYGTGVVLKNTLDKRPSPQPAQLEQTIQKTSIQPESVKSNDQPEKVNANWPY